MIRRALIFGLVFAVMQAAPTQHEVKSKPCEGMTQQEMNVCAGAEFKLADAELNRLYQELLKKAEGNQLATTKIKKAEQSWIVYRDAYLEAMYPAENKQKEYGSIYPMESMMFRTELTRRQIAAIKDLLGQYSDQKPAD